MKKSKCSFWIKQLRRPLCALVALCIVVFYCMTSYAEESDTFSFKEKYFPNDSVQYMTTKAMYEQYGIEHDNSKLSVYRNVSYYFALNDVWQLLGTSMSNGIPTSAYNDFITWATSLNIPKTFTQNSIDYPLENTYIIMSSNSYYSMNYYCIIPQGYCCLVDGYVVSESPFIVYTTIRDNNTNIYNINQASANGLYCFTPHLTGDSYTDTFFFTDLDMFFKTSDLGSGYSSFSLNDVGDFNISDSRNNYYNFNYLKTGGVIVAPSDPAENPYNADGEHYNYGTVSHKVFGKPFDSLYYGTTIGINSYMRDYSNRFWLFTDAKIGVKFAGENTVSEYEQNDSESVSAFIRNNSNTYSVLLDPGLMMGPGGSLAAKLRSGYSNIAGSDFGYTEGIWSDGSFVFPDDSGFGSYYEYTYKPLKNSLLGNSDNKLEVAYLDLTSWFSYDGTNDDILNVDTNSGYYHVRFNLLNGTYNVIQNDISQNLNPIEGENDLPISGIGGGSSGGSGNINISQGGISNNLNAIIEYLFQLDASGIQNVSQNVGSTIQYVVSNIGDTRNVENGFWDVLKKGYSVIPDDIWNWIKISVATLLSGAVITWVYNGVRVKRG